MSLPPGPRPDFIFIQPQPLGLAKAGLNRPASTRGYGERGHRGTDRREHEIRRDLRGSIKGSAQQHPALPTWLQGTVGREVGPVVEAGPLASLPGAQALPLSGWWEVLSYQVPNGDLAHAPPDVLLATNRQHITLLPRF